MRIKDRFGSSVAVVEVLIGRDRWYLVIDGNIIRAGQALTLMKTCCPVGRPRMCSSVGNAKRKRRTLWEMSFLILSLRETHLLLRALSGPGAAATGGGGGRVRPVASSPR